MEAKEIKHNLVPKQVLLSEEETKKLLSKFNVLPMQLPKIKKKDPAIAHLDPKPGSIIKITRKSETAHKTNFYRVVME